MSCTKPVSAQPTLIKPAENKPATDQPSLTKFVENQSTPSEPVQKQPTLIKPVENQPTKYNDNIVVVGEIKKGKRKAVQLAVKSAVPKKNIAGLIPVIQSGKWLEDEQTDAQAMLAKQFTSIRGLQPVCTFEPQGCQRVGTSENAFVQILNVNDNHWL